MLCSFIEIWVKKCQYHLLKVFTRTLWGLKLKEVATRNTLLSSQSRHNILKFAEASVKKQHGADRFSASASESTTRYHLLNLQWRKSKVQFVESPMKKQYGTIYKIFTEEATSCSLFKHQWSDTMIEFVESLAKNQHRTVIVKHLKKWWRLKKNSRYWHALSCIFYSTHMLRTYIC